MTTGANLFLHLLDAAKLDQRETPRFGFGDAIA